MAGDKDELANYCKLLASKGFIVAAANYSLAPGANFPVPTRQINTAIGFLVKHASDLAIDSSQIVVAGDSGGAHTTAQLANAFTDPQFAAMLNISPSTDPANLKGVILFCGPYNGALADLNGSFGWFLKTVLWSYIGQKDFTKAPSYKYFSISDYITTHFPKTFISVGNNDPLRLHSYELATRLSSKGVTVDSLFFPDNYAPALPHEYQFNLDNAAGQLALNRTLEFLSSCFAKGHPR